MRLPGLLRSRVADANEANANEPANERAIAPPPTAVREARPGWWSRRQAIRLAARRAYAAVRAHPSPLSRTAELIAWVISGLAYAISYASLYTLASHHDFAGPYGWESIAWPTTVDLASLATALIAIDQAHRGESAWLAGAISAVAAAIMVAGNVVGAWGDAITVAMHAWPPLIALACWYLLVRTRRANALLAGYAAESEGGEASGSQEGSQGKRKGGSRFDPRVLRIARTGGDWKRVAHATGLSEHAAKRALTAARKLAAQQAERAA